MSELDRIQDLGRAGFQCSQVLLTLALDLQGKTDDDLIRAGHALCQGMAAGETCGALTGGACFLGLYAGRGTRAEEDDPRLLFMLDELVEWFKDGYGREYGSIRCDDIVGEYGTSMQTRCPAIVLGVYQKVTELLVANGFDLAVGRDGSAGRPGNGAA